MKQKDLSDLYAWIRTNNQSTPDDVIDFMYEAAKEKLITLNKSEIDSKDAINKALNLINKIASIPDDAWFESTTRMICREAKDIIDSHPTRPKT
jgi:uncharacterized protein YfkK (UPF0435 family)